MTEITCTYTGDGQTTLQHGPSGAIIHTDLPPDNGGKGRQFSPTDLLAGAFASCVLTIMGKMAAARQESLDGAKIDITKEMAQNPRRIGKFILRVQFPAHFTQAQKDFYKTAIHACPVHQSLRTDIELDIQIL